MGLVEQGEKTTTAPPVTGAASAALTSISPQAKSCMVLVKDLAPKLEMASLEDWPVTNEVRPRKSGSRRRYSQMVRQTMRRCTKTMAR